MGLFDLFLVSAALLREPPPIIIQGAGNQTLSTGTLAILPCKAIGHTQPSVAWTKDGLPLDRSVPFLFTSPVLSLLPSVPTRPLQSH